MTERDSVPPVMLFTTVVEYKLNYKRTSASNRDCGENGERETYGVDDEVVDKPREGNSSEADPVALDDQPVGNLGVLHRIAFEPVRLIHVQSPNQDGKGGDDTETKGETPDGPEVVGSEAKIQR